MTLSSRLTGISAFFLGVALFYAPLAYGCTRPDMLPLLYLLLALSIAAGFAGMMIRGTWPDVPKTALICFAAIMFQGWWMMADPILPSMVPDNGGLVDTSLDNLTQLSFNAILLVTVTLGTFLIACDTLVDPEWRRFVLMCAAISGVLVSVVGIFLKTKLGAPFMTWVWKPSEIDTNNFAFFRHHSTAGALLNLAWPLILVFTRRAFEIKEIAWPTRVIWTTASFLCGLALVLNTSKAALAIGLLILPWPFSTGIKRLESNKLFLLGLASVFVLAVMLFASSHLVHETAFNRMTNANDVSESVDGRWQAYRQYLEDVPQAGWFGIGPGLFQVAYPYQNISFRNYDASVRQFAHEDFLQTTLEWGWLGTVWWTLLVGGGLYRAIHAYAQRERFQSRTDRHLVLACILGVLGALACALFDFPLQVASVRLFFLVELALCWAAPGILAPPPRDPNRLRYPIRVPSEAIADTSGAWASSP